MPVVIGILNKQNDLLLINSIPGLVFSPCPYFEWLQVFLKQRLITEWDRESLGSQLWPISRDLAKPELCLWQEKFAICWALRGSWELLGWVCTWAKFPAHKEAAARTCRGNTISVHGSSRAFKWVLQESGCAECTACLNCKIKNLSLKKAQL